MSRIAINHFFITVFRERERERKVCNKKIEEQTLDIDVISSMMIKNEF